MQSERGFFNRIAPVVTLAFMAPLFAEVLPGATRFSSIFVFPIEMAVWGGGAVMARALVRSRRLGWWSLLLLGLALSVAEEFLIQQTSVAPMVIRLKGETWARAFDVNYVYLIWALVYETAWVVLIPTLGTELIFADRREQPWLNRTGAVVTAILFLIGCFLAWFSWTQIARTKVFHQPPFTPPLYWVLIAVAAIVLLIVSSLRPRRSATPSTASGASSLVARNSERRLGGTVVRACRARLRNRAPSLANRRGCRWTSSSHCCCCSSYLAGLRTPAGIAATPMH